MAVLMCIYLTLILHKIVWCNIRRINKLYTYNVFKITQNCVKNAK